MDEGRRLCRNIGLRVVEIRRDRDLTQEDLAERLRMDPRELRRIEAGGNITIHTLAKIARALDVAVADLFASPSKLTKRRPGRPKKTG